MEARLENIQSGENWETMCNTTPNVVHGIKFKNPTSCENRVRAVSSLLLSPLHRSTQLTAHPFCILRAFGTAWSGYGSISTRSADMLKALRLSSDFLPKRLLIMTSSGITVCHFLLSKLG